MTSDGWGCSCMYIAAKYDECSDYFSWPYMNLLLVFFFFFLPHVPFPGVFSQMGSQAAPFRIIAEIYGVIPFRYKIDPFLKCVPLVPSLILTYAREQANEHLSNLRLIKKQTQTNKDLTPTSITFFQASNKCYFRFFRSSVSVPDLWVCFIFRFIFLLIYFYILVKLTYFLFIIPIWYSVFLTYRSLFSCFLW